MEKELMNLFRQFKLGNSLFKWQHKVSNFTLQHYNTIDVYDIIKRDAIKSLSNFILNSHKSAIKDIKKEDYRQMEVELLVLKMEDFKTIVEAAIQMIPDEKIKEIKQGNSIF